MTVNMPRSACIVHKLTTHNLPNLFKEVVYLICSEKDREELGEEREVFPPTCKTVSDAFFILVSTENKLVCSTTQVGSCHVQLHHAVEVISDARHSIIRDMEIRIRVGRSKHSTISQAFQ